jgi:hypothetical protein
VPSLILLSSLPAQRVRRSSRYAEQNMNVPQIGNLAR